MQFGGLGELIDTVECRVGFGELCFVEQTNADPASARAVMPAPGTSRPENVPSKTSELPHDGE